MSTKFLPVQSLVRGGLSEKEALVNNYNYSLNQTGTGSISARSAPNKTASELAYHQPTFPNGSYSHTIIKKIRDLGEDWDVIDTPSKNPNIPFHVDIMTPNNKVLSDEDARNLSGVFQTIPYDKNRKLPNYGRGKRR